jgi:predicted DNA-binding protein (MmcQ/YjbR family)
MRRALRAFALTLPAAYEDFPWGESAIKVDRKIFAFLGENASRSPTISLKLPGSRFAALGVPGAAPTAYALGKAAWVTIPLSGTLPPVDVLREWVAESYRAVARKSRVAELDRIMP